MLIKILLSGDGGQGIQLISDLLCRVAFDKGYFVTYIPNYGLEQRGGVSLAFIQISDNEIVYPKFSKPDLLLIMSNQARARTERYQLSYVKILDIKDFTENLKNSNVPMQSSNVFFLGQITKFLEDKNIFKKEDLHNLLRKKLENKPGWIENERVFSLNY